MMDWIGKTLGKVYIESLLARGGMAEVYLGTHITLQRKVAVKLLRPYQTDDIQLRPRERFELEARAVAGLRHPNIVQVFDYDTIDDQPYLVMEYISGPSLSKYLSVLHSREGRLGLPLIERLLNRIAGALQYAHESGVIHRDVKPGNILLTSRSIQILPGETLPLDLEPVLTDFGLVRFLNSSRQTASGLITGTPAYMSPEQAMGQIADGRTDIYSLGIVLYEMLSGNVPFDAETTMSILLKHMNEAPPPIPGLSPALQRVLDRALAKSPDDRFQQPEELSAAFSSALEGRADATTLAFSPPPAPVKVKAAPPPEKRNLRLPLLLAGLLVLLLAIPLLFQGVFPPAGGTPSPNPAIGDTAVTTPVLGIPVTLGPTGMLHFQDGDAILDQATLIAYAMPAAPTGSNYEVWLLNDEERLSLGTLNVDGSGRGELTYNDLRDVNLLANYHTVEVTIEDDSTAGFDSATEIAFAYSMPNAGLAYLRRLMVSFPSTPDQVSLLHGLTGNSQAIQESASELLLDYQNGDETGIKANAESIMNLLVGEHSADYQDWNGNGQVADPGDGYGLMLNGNHLGYIQAVFSHADYAVNAPGATRSMVDNGENVKACAQNLAGWAPELRNQMLIILNAGTLTEMDAAVQRSAEIAQRMLGGLDPDENGQAETESEECGVLEMYDYAYHMADMPLLPVAIDPQGAPVAVTVTVTPTSTSMGGSLIPVSPTRNSDSAPPATAIPPTSAPPVNPSVSPPVNPPTDPPPGNSNPRPTREPRPTNDPGPPENPGPPGNSGSANNPGQGSRPTPRP